jgi:hypothetical protein
LEWQLQCETGGSEIVRELVLKLCDCPRGHEGGGLYDDVSSLMSEHFLTSGDVEKVCFYELDLHSIRSGEERGVRFATSSVPADKGETFDVPPCSQPLRDPQPEVTHTEDGYTCHHFSIRVW